MDSGQRGPNGQRALCVVVVFTPEFATATLRRLRTVGFHALVTTLSGKSVAMDAAKVRLHHLSLIHI